MKIFEIASLLEYNSKITLDKWRSKLEAPAKREGITPEQSLVQLEQMDPTRNKQYMIWLVKNFVNNKFRLEDRQRTKDALSNYHSIKQRLPVEQRDIGRFDLHQLEDLVDSIFNPDLGTQDFTSNREIPEDTEVLYIGPLGLLAVPKTEEASCILGSGTKWCTAAREDNQFSAYANDGNLYIWIDKSGDKYQFHFGVSPQFMDARDRPIEGEKLESFRTEHPVISKLFKKYEPEMAKNPDRAVGYALALGAPWPPGEKAIASDSLTAMEYAMGVIKGRWPPGEKVIMADPMTAYEYAFDAIRGRFYEAEPVILTDPEAALSYAINVLGEPWPEAEPLFARSIHRSNAYLEEFPQRAKVMHQLKFGNR